MPLDPTLRTILDQIAAQPGPKLQEMTPEQARRFFEEMQIPQPEIGVAAVEDRRIPGPAGEIPARIYRPEAAGELPALVYFHGGGWVIGGLDTHDPTCRDLANRGRCAVVSVDYRLAPEHRYPAAPEDCYAALRWVAEQAGALGVDAGRLAVGGDSAGGNLAAVTTLLARERGGPSLAFQLLVYPATDCVFDRPSHVENAEGYLLETAAMEWFWGHYLPDRVRRAEPTASPLRAGSHAGLPPALVITAEFDPLRDEGEAYAERLQRAGVPTRCSRYDGMIHGFFAMSALVDGAKRAMEEAGSALRGALHG
jgi:acetyl esterase